MSRGQTNCGRSASDDVEVGGVGGVDDFSVWPKGLQFFTTDDMPVPVTTTGGTR